MRVNKLTIREKKIPTKRNITTKCSFILYPNICIKIQRNIKREGDCKLSKETLFQIHFSIVSSYTVLWWCYVLTNKVSQLIGGIAVAQ